jgi:hypothetical protein
MREISNRLVEPFDEHLRSSWMRLPHVCDERHLRDSDDAAHPTLVSPTAVNGVKHRSLFDNFVLGVHPAPKVSFDLFQAVSNETARFFQQR